MLKQFVKIKSYFILFVLIKKIWRQPRQSDVLIFDACGQEYLMDYLSPWQPEVLHVRREQINIFALIAGFFKRSKISEAYVDCYIKKVQPKIIVTFIDNNPSFYSISLRHPSIKTFFIQNGLRSYYADIFEILDKSDSNVIDSFHVDYMMTLGLVVGNEYARYISGKLVPMGSLKSNSLCRQQSKQKDVLAFVSQWYEEGFYLGEVYYSHGDYFDQVDRPVVQCLSKYAKVNNKRLFIIPRHSQSGELRSKEKLYFQDILGDDLEFLEPSGINSSYQAVDAAEVVVSIDSTLGYESIARGNKTAIFSMRSALFKLPGLNYGWPGNFANEGPFWSNYLNNDSFIRILDYLFLADKTQWQKDVDESDFSSLMFHDSGNTIFKSLIEKELGPSTLLAFVQPNSGVPDK